MHSSVLMASAMAMAAAAARKKNYPNETLTALNSILCKQYMQDCRCIFLPSLEIAIGSTGGHTENGWCDCAYDSRFSIRMAH